MLAKGDRPPVAIGRDVPDGRVNGMMTPGGEESCMIRANSTSADAFGLRRHEGPRGLVLPVKWICWRPFGGIGPKAAAGTNEDPAQPNCREGMASSGARLRSQSRKRSDTGSAPSAPAVPSE